MMGSPRRQICFSCILLKPFGLHVRREVLPLAQPATLSERQLVHQGAMLRDGQGARSLLFGGSLGCLHTVPTSLMFVDVN